jgi:predicted dehydrogenase
MPLKVVGIGAGYFSDYHYDAWQRIGCVDLVAICDLDLTRADATAKRHGIPLVFDQFSAMLDETKPDIIDIITPPESHKELLSIALAANAAIICQKPLAPTLADARRMVAMAEAKDRHFFVHENFRFQPWYVEIKALLDRHVIGTPYSVSFRLRPGDGRGPNAYLSRQPYFQQMERFLVHETGVHFVDTYRYLFGEVKRVYADLHRLNPHICGEDAGIILFEFEQAGRGL